MEGSGIGFRQAVVVGRSRQLVAGGLPTGPVTGIGMSGKDDMKQEFYTDPVCTPLTRVCAYHWSTYHSGTVALLGIRNSPRGHTFPQSP
jgi:hypothetical protein